MALKEVEIRLMRLEDLDAVVEIDRKVLGKERKMFWEEKIESYKKRSPMPGLVAVVDGKVVGFIMGEVSGWEYGIPETYGYLDTMGVDPEYQHKGIGTLLFKELKAHFRELGVNVIYTFVDWRNWTLLKFFDAMGFTKGEMINLELRI